MSALFVLPSFMSALGQLETNCSRQSMSAVVLHPDQFSKNADIAD
jgi:hypothetical protein